MENKNEVTISKYSAAENGKAIDYVYDACIMLKSLYDDGSSYKSKIGLLRIISSALGDNTTPCDVEDSEIELSIDVIKLDDGAYGQILAEYEGDGVRFNNDINKAVSEYCNDNDIKIPTTIEFDNDKYMKFGEIPNVKFISLDKGVSLIRENVETMDITRYSNTEGYGSIELKVREINIRGSRTNILIQDKNINFLDIRHLSRLAAIKYLSFFSKFGAMAFMRTLFNMCIIKDITYDSNLKSGNTLNMVTTEPIYDPIFIVPSDIFCENILEKSLIMDNNYDYSALTVRLSEFIEWENSLNKDNPEC